MCEICIAVAGASALCLTHLVRHISRCGYSKNLEVECIDCQGTEIVPGEVTASGGTDCSRCAGCGEERRSED